MTKLCLILEMFRRTDEGRIRDAKAFLAHFFPQDKNGATDRLFLHIPKEVRADLLSNWGIRGKKSALRDDDDRVRTTVSDALNAGDIDASVIEEGVTPEILIDWVPLDDWWRFWRGPILPVGSVRKALAVARELSLFDERWFFENLVLGSQKLDGTDVVCAALSKEQVSAWVQSIHASGDSSPAGLVAAVGWETILAKTAHEALLHALDALARQVGLVDDPRSSSERPAPLSASVEPPAMASAPSPVAPPVAVTVSTPTPVDVKPVSAPQPSRPPPVPSKPPPPLPPARAGASKPPPPLPPAAMGAKPAEAPRAPEAAKPSEPRPPEPKPAEPRLAEPKLTSIAASPVVVVEAPPPAPTPPHAAPRSSAISAPPKAPPPARHMPVDALPSVIVEPDPPAEMPSVIVEPDPFAPPASGPAAGPASTPTARALFGAPESRPSPGAAALAAHVANLPPMRKPAETLAGVGTPPPFEHAPVAPAVAAAPAKAFPTPAAADPPWAPPRAEPGDMGWDLLFGVKRPMATNVAPRYNFDDDDEPTSEIALPGDHRPR